MQTYHAGPGVYARVPASGDGSAVEEHTATTPAHDVGVVALLVAIERLIEAHADELDTLNVFPVPDADTGRNVLATVRSARAAAEQAAPGDRRGQAVTGALRGARGNAGVLTSQLLRALVEDGGGDWAERLGTADQLCRGAGAHPVEGSFLTAVGDAATASSAVGAGEQLAVAVAAAGAAAAAFAASVGGDGTPGAPTAASGAQGRGRPGSLTRRPRSAAGAALRASVRQADTGV